MRWEHQLRGKCSLWPWEVTAPISCLTALALCEAMTKSTFPSSWAFFFFNCNLVFQKCCSSFPSRLMLRVDVQRTSVIRTSAWRTLFLPSEVTGCSQHSGTRVKNSMQRQKYSWRLLGLSKSCFSLWGQKLSKLVMKSEGRWTSDCLTAVWWLGCLRWAWGIQVRVTACRSLTSHRLLPVPGRISLPGAAPLALVTGKGAWTWWMP